MVGELTYKEAGRLKKGNYVYIDDEVWRVEDVSVSVAGKHGAAKARLKLRSFFGDKTKEVVLSSDEKVAVPTIEKRRGQVLSIVERDDEGKPKLVQVMDMETYETFEMGVADDVKDKIEEGKEVIYWDILGKKIVMQVAGGK